MLTTLPPVTGQDELPRLAALEDQLRFALNYAIRAPSGHNTQPWLFDVAAERIDLYCDRSRALPAIDPDERELIISCGAALFHLRIALAHFGFEHRVELAMNERASELLARVHIVGRRDRAEDEPELFRAIPRRRTCRAPFEPLSVREALLSGFRRAAQVEGSFLHIIRGAPARLTAAELIAEADRIQLRDPRIRAELAEWIRPGNAPERDGLSATALGMGHWSSALEPMIRFAMRHLNLGAMASKRDRRLALGSPVLAVLGTAADDGPAWLAAGQGLARVLLSAAAHGISAAFMNQPIEVSALRERVRELIGGKGFPQIMLRMGYGPPVPASPRRGIEEVVLRRNGEVMV